MGERLTTGGNEEAPRQTGRRSPRQRARLAALRLAGSLCSPRAGEVIQYVRLNRTKAPRSVLLIRPDHLGDLLFTTPALHALRSALPQAHLALLAGPWGAEAVRGNPDLDAVHILRFPGFERRQRRDPTAPYRLLFETAREIRDRNYDAAVTLRFDHWWGAWLAAAAGIPQRIGYAWLETLPFLTTAVPYTVGRHEVEQNAALLASLVGDPAQTKPGRLIYNIGSEDRDWAQNWLARGGTKDEPGESGSRPLIAIHAGAGAAVKQWPASCWASLAEGLRRIAGARILLTGGPGERDLASEVAGSMREEPLNAAGETASVGQLAALLDRCDLVVGADCGPLHLAAAIGVPTLHLYGPVAAGSFGPWGDPTEHRVVTAKWACVPCNRLDWPAADLQLHGCMRSITVEQVLDEALCILGRRENKG